MLRSQAPGPPSWRTVLGAWWPLAASWLLMGLELPAVSAVMARLPDPKVSLAAYGGVVFPLSMLIEAPILMLLSTSTALSRDRVSYRIGAGFMWRAGTALSAFHALVAFTPLYDVLVGRVLGAPHEILEPARLGLRIMTPWTLAIAYRRFQQGMLIRTGRARVVGVGTGVRLLANFAVLAVGLGLHRVPGIVVGTTAVACGVTAEALFAALVVGPARREIERAPASVPALTRQRFLHFYTPLAVTPLLLLLSGPLASAAMSRMPNALASLAAWPVVNGLVFTLRSTGFALNEVVVSQLERPGMARPLRRFAHGVALVTSALLLGIAVSPVGTAWLARVTALPADLVPLARLGLLLSAPMPALAALQSWHQGVLLHGHRTRAVTEAMALFLIATAVLLQVGVMWGRASGLAVTVVAMSLATIGQLTWLARRARPLAGALRAAPAAPPHVVHAAGS
jgi:progressive ankylosis protein